MLRLLLGCTHHKCLMGISVGIQPFGGDDRLLVGVVVGCLLVQPMELHPNLHMIFAPGFVLAILHGVVRALVRQAEMQLYVVYAGVHQPQTVRSSSAA